MCFIHDHIFRSCLNFIKKKLEFHSLIFGIFEILLGGFYKFISRNFWIYFEEIAVRKNGAVRALWPTDKQQVAETNQKLPKSLSTSNFHFLNFKRWIYRTHLKPIFILLFW